MSAEWGMSKGGQNKTRAVENPLNGNGAAIAVHTKTSNSPPVGSARASPTMRKDGAMKSSSPPPPKLAGDGGPPSDGPDSEIIWHAIQTAEEVYNFADTSLAGLTDAEATRRASIYGPNMMTMGTKRTMWQKIWEQVNNIIMYILLVSATVSGGFEEWEEFALILLVVIVNVVIGVLQEGKAEKATEAIKAMLSSQVRAGGLECVTDVRACARVAFYCPYSALTRGVRVLAPSLCRPPSFALACGARWTPRCWCPATCALCCPATACQRTCDGCRSIPCRRVVVRVYLHAPARGCVGAQLFKKRLPCLYIAEAMLTIL